jgi:hypothetical protein
MAQQQKKDGTPSRDPARRRRTEQPLRAAGMLVPLGQNLLAAPGAEALRLV